MTSPIIPAGASGTQSVAGGNGTTFAPTKPTGTASGDELYAMFFVDTGNAVTMPTGFANLYNLNPSGTMHLRVDWKIADGTEGTTLSWSWTGSVWRVGALIRVTGGVTSGTPHENQASATNTTSQASNNATLPSIALTGAASVDDLALLVSAISLDNAPAWSAPSGWTIQFNSGDDIGIIKQTLASGAAAPASTHVTVSDSNVSVGPGASAVLAVMSPSGGGGGFDPSTVPWTIETPPVAALAVLGF